MLMHADPALPPVQYRGPSQGHTLPNALIGMIRTGRTSGCGAKMMRLYLNKWYFGDESYV